MKPFGKYDTGKLTQARKLLVEVYEYHYGSSDRKQEVSRLETIINKLDTLIHQNET